MSDVSPPTPSRSETARQLLDQYWRINKIVMCILLLCWATVSLGAGVLFADTLNKWTLPGTAYPLGFWFAQQGSVVCFVAIILIYAIIMNRVDAGYLRKLNGQGGHS